MDSKDKEDTTNKGEEEDDKKVNPEEGENEAAKESEDKEQSAEQDANANKKKKKKPFKKKMRQTGKKEKNGILSQTSELEVLEKSHYQKRAFYHCIDTKEPVKILLDEYRKECNTQVEFHESLFGVSISQVETEIKELETRLQELRDQAKTYRESGDELEGECTKLKEEVEELKGVLIKLLKGFQEKKKQFVESQTSQRLEKLGEDIRLLIKNSSILSDEIEEKHDEYLRNNSESREEFVSHLRDESEKVKKRLDRFNMLIEKLNERFVNNITVRTIGLVCLAAIGAAGWFFSIFAIETKLDSADQSSFLLGLVFSFGEALFQTDQGIQANVLTLVLTIVGVLAILALVSAVIYLCHRLLNGRKKEAKSISFFDRDGNAMVLPVPDDESDKSTIWAIWLKNLPYILIGVLIFVFLVFFSGYSGFNTDSEGESELNKLTIALSAQIIGVALSLIAGGLTYLYVNFVVESRIEKHDKLRPRHFWELIGVFGLFFILLVFIPFLPQIKGDDYLGDLALTLFFTVVLANGFLIGYYIKLSSMLSSRTHEESKYIYLKNLILQSTHNVGFDKGKGIYSELKERIDKLNAQMFDPMMLENKETGLLATRKLNENDDRFKRAFQKLLKDTKSILRKQYEKLSAGWSLWKQKVKGESVDKDKDENAEVIEGEMNLIDEKIQDLESVDIPRSLGLEFEDYVAREYFVGDYHEIRVLIAQLKERVILYESTQTELRQLKEGDSPFLKKLENAISDIEQELIEKKRERLTEQKDLQLEIVRTKRKYEKIYHELQQGHELALWFQKNGPMSTSI